MKINYMKSTSSKQHYKNLFMEWENKVETTYNEEDVLSIHGMISYFENIFNNYGKYNDENLFQSEINSPNGQNLLKEAKIGWELLLLCKKK